MHPWDYTLPMKVVTQLDFTCESLLDTCVLNLFGDKIGLGRLVQTLWLAILLSQSIFLGNL